MICRSGTIFLWVFAALLLTACGGNKTTFKEKFSNTQPISHTIWDGLLKKNVDAEGWVDYQAFILDSTRLNSYLELVSNNPPNPNNWSKAAKMAYWINAYNAFTVQIMIRNYPVKSIKDISKGVSIPFINSTWDIKFIKIGGEVFDLNNLEHNILRKEFSDPRIHFAIVCASYSCPPLRNEAFTPEKLEDQLEDQADSFINDRERNQIESAFEANLSKIFFWYGGDFKKETTLVDFLNRYSDTKLQKGAQINYLDYNWSINEKASP